MKHFLCLGSNQGNRQGFLLSAKYLLEKEGCNIKKESSYYETEPVGMKEDSPSFINQVILLESKLEPMSFLDFTKEVEKKIGRKTKGDYLDRVIDIDILFCDDLIIDEESLKIPHPHILERRFVLEPLNEIAPDFKHPIAGKTISELLDSLEDSFSVEIYV